MESQIQAVRSVPRGARWAAAATMTTSMRLAGVSPNSPM